jgi:2-oxoglutarate/2-oxoacid ferredoxin oxidoreductase subunit beta
METELISPIFTSKDLETDQEVRWCPGCGDYAILNSVKKILPDFGLPKHQFVFVSGIGCSSRFPYYMDTYGMHSIHGRATSIATGLKIANPELSVWVITGDGDALSIGGNHFIHTLRRNPNLNILLFNNQIYGLTKGQFSPTSLHGQVTKSSPLGVVDSPFNPLALALGAGSTFVARTLDRDAKHQQEIYKRAYYHPGTSLVEIYQNCNVFNDGAFEVFTDKASKPETTIFVEHGKPLLFDNGSKGIVLDGLNAKIVNSEDISPNDLWIHDENDLNKALLLSRFFDDENMPRPFGVIYVDAQKPVFDTIFNQQIAERKIEDKETAFAKLLKSNNSWVVG